MRNSFRDIKSLKNDKKNETKGKSDFFDLKWKKKINIQSSQ